MCVITSGLWEKASVRCFRVGSDAHCVPAAARSRAFFSVRQPLRLSSPSQRSTAVGLFDTFATTFHIARCAAWRSAEDPEAVVGRGVPRAAVPGHVSALGASSGDALARHETDFNVDSNAFEMSASGWSLMDSLIKCATPAAARSLPLESVAIDAAVRVLDLNAASFLKSWASRCLVRLGM